MNSININKRYIFVDLMKVIAIVTVLLNHSDVYWWVPSIDTPVTFCIIIKLVIAEICKVGAPLFFICSGILLLSRDESFSSILCHRITRIICVMFIFTIYNVMDDLTLKNIYFYFVTGFNWYIYAYLLFLLMLPFLRNLVKCDTKLKILFIFTVGAFYAVAGQALVTNLNPLMGMTSNAQSIFYHGGTHGGWNIIYPISGYFIYELLRLDSDESSILYKIIVFLGGCSVVVSIFVYCKDLHYTNASNYEMIRQNFIYFPTLSIEAILIKYDRHISSLLKDKGQKIVKSVAELTFGIFLLETSTNIRNTWEPLIDSIGFALKFSYYSSVVFKVLFAFVMYSIIVYVIRLIPFVRKIL